MESKFKLPTETITLPSKGLLYPKDNPLSAGELEMSYMSAKHEDILTNFKIIVYSRGAVDEKWEHYKNLLLFDAPYIHISATYIRHLVKQGKSIRYLVPEQVEEEIKKCFE